MQDKKSYPIQVRITFKHSKIPFFFVVQDLIILFPADLSVYIRVLSHLFFHKLNPIVPKAQFDNWVIRYLH